MCSFAETTHTPQGDGNPNCTAYIADNYLETTHTPQGDGNNVFLAFVCFLPLKQPTPRKGTETRRNSQRTLQGIYKTIYTPLGDGNAINLISSFFVIGNNPHPVRGRKRLVVIVDPLDVIETTHTPRGDGNF